METRSTEILFFINDFLDSNATDENRLDGTFTKNTDATSENGLDAPLDANHLPDHNAAKDNEFDATSSVGDVVVYFFLISK